MTSSTRMRLVCGSQTVHSQLPGRTPSGTLAAGVAWIETRTAAREQTRLDTFGSARCTCFSVPGSSVVTGGTVGAPGRHRRR